MRVYPFDDVVASASELLRSGRVATVWQRFVCATCGNSLTIEEPAVFYTHATCDRCHALTNVAEQGCNYTAIMGRRALVAATLGRALPDDVEVRVTADGRARLQ